jgi:hypothetical protein
MTTPEGRAHCIARLGDCPTADALRRVWESLGVDYQRDETVQAFKDRMKEQLK